MKQPWLLLLIVIIGALTPQFAKAQLGGTQVYQFMELPQSARVAALGGSYNTIRDDDITLAAQNPSLLNKSMDQHLSFSVVDYLKDIMYGYATYGKHFKGVGTFQAGIQYVNYGDFTRADRFGNITGSFNAGEYNLKVGGARPLGDFSIGATVNLIYSSLETYTSFGTALDVGISYHDEDNLINTALVFKNAGFQIKPYTSNNSEPLPLNIELGFSKKFEHMPLRLTLIAHHLNKPDITGETTTSNGLTNLETGQPQQTEPPLSEKIFRHFIIGGELVFSPNFHLRVGYNHQRRKELTLENKKGLVGFTFGGGIKISKFHLSYGRAAYHMAGASNHFTVTTNLSEFFVE